MPTYEYVCDACDHAFELFQQMTAPVKRKCPECGKLKLRRLVGTGAGVIFRGSGFYETDYRSESYKKAAESETKKPDDKKKEGAEKAKDGAAAKDAKAEGAKPASKRKGKGRAEPD